MHYELVRLIMINDETLAHCTFVRFCLAYLIISLIIREKELFLWLIGFSLLGDSLETFQRFLRQPVFSASQLETSGPLLLSSYEAQHRNFSHC